MKSHLKAGQYNLKGKKFKLLKCNCCSIFNVKNHILNKIILKEMNIEKDSGY